MKKIVFCNRPGIGRWIELRNWLIIKIAGKSTILINADLGWDDNQQYAAVNLSKPNGLIVNCKFDMSRLTGVVRGWEFR